METSDAPLFLRLLGQHVSGLDAAYAPQGEFRGVELPTEEDEVMFRRHLLSDDTTDDIHRVGDRLYFVAPRLSPDVCRCIGQDAFEAAAAPLTAVGLELRGEGVLRRLEEAMDAARPSFAGQPPVLCAV
jgi:hypothetical protein